MAAGNPLLVRLVTPLTCGDQLLPIAHHVRPQQLGAQQIQFPGTETVLSQPPGDAAVTGIHLLQERRHRFRTGPVGVRGHAVDIASVRR